MSNPNSLNPEPPKFQNKYRIESARLKGWDYRNPGAYFITICTKDKEHFFGECKNGRMILSTMGAIVQGFWYEIPKHFGHARLGEFIVMPNHVHGILILDGMVGDNADHVETRQCLVSTQTQTNPNDPPESEFYQRISPKPGSVSVIIGSFKSICTKHIRQTFPDLDFKWQERFYDHIIRDDKSFVHISNYIANNPLKWEEDKHYENTKNNP